MTTYIILVPMRTNPSRPVGPSNPLTPPAIKCLVCQRVSYYPKDISERYCGFCHRFHDDMEREATREHEG